VSAGLQHALTPTLAVNATYFRRAYKNFQATDNAAIGLHDYDPYCVTVPQDARLPGAGGQICGLFDLSPAKVGVSDPIIRLNDKFGNQFENWNGVDITLNARMRRVVVQGGLSTGKTATDTCDITRSNPDVVTNSSIGGNSGPSYSTDFCHVETPFLTQVKLLGVVPLPWSLQVSGTYQSLPGPHISANAAFTSAQIAPSLGRPLSSASTAVVNIVSPGTLYGERLNQLDMRLSKTVRIGRTRIEGILDIFNALNGNAVTAVNNTYGSTGATWLQPTQVLAARLLRLGAQVSF
jgi:hypothetical protein